MTTTSMQYEIRSVNWKFALITSILFGWLGVDRFYMGQPLLGILKLLTVGLGGIWWLIDILLIAGKYQFKNIIWEI